MTTRTQNSLFVPRPDTSTDPGRDCLLITCKDQRRYVECVEAVTVLIVSAASHRGDMEERPSM